MEIALSVLLLFIIFMIVLNGYLDGQLKDNIDIAFSIAWVGLIVFVFIYYGWKIGVGNILSSFITAWLVRPFAAYVAKFLYSHPPKKVQ